MSSSYSGEKIMQRQRICPRCKSFVTHEKVEGNQFACALCGNRVDGPPTRQARIGPREIAALVAHQEKKRQSDQS